jgi:nitrogen fixation/metabolism regulation signal transduction histidine kinase
LNGFIGYAMAKVEHETVRQFFELIGSHLSSRTGDWRQEINLFGSGGRRVLMCRGSSLVDPMSLDSGHVIVFDDITALVQVERDAAWGEVAKRLAHEIKNPLTPIQLAAERIRHKFLGTMDESQARILDRSTHTIIQQVQALKEMVNDFNEFARAPKLNVVPVPLNDFIAEVMYLYRDYPAGVEIKLDLDAANPIIEADKGRLRQLLHNVVKNAIEAMKDAEGSCVTLSTHCDRQADTNYVELSFQDNGPGFPEGSMGNIFEPYVTNKAKGTGLGLAIVKKIVEEHGGVIRAETPPEGGARIAIRFPVKAFSTEAARVDTVDLLPIQEAG